MLLPQSALSPHNQQRTIIDIHLVFMQTITKSKHFVQKVPKSALTEKNRSFASHNTYPNNIKLLLKNKAWKVLIVIAKALTLWQ